MVGKENENAWKASIKEIEKRSYNLDFKNPSKKENLEHKDLEELRRRRGKLLKF